MDLENTKENKLTYKKCQFCRKDLKPIGFDYLYVNVDINSIKFERCKCEKSIRYWKEKDLEEEKVLRKKHYAEIINKLFEGNVAQRFQEYNFENISANCNVTKDLEILEQYTNKCIKNNQSEGIIITSDSGDLRTKLGAAIANRLIRNNQIVLMNRVASLLKAIKDTFYNNESEKELIELYSKIDMLIIYDLGIEKISSWGLEKLFTILSNRYENNLPVIITTKFNKDNLLKRFLESNDKELSESVITILYQMCYGIDLNQKEKASISAQTKC